METETTKTEPPSNENSSPEDITSPVSQESPQPVIEEKVVEETKVEDVDLTKEDTFVWAKLAGYPFWPGQVVNPSGTGLSAKKGSVIVKFYGTNDYAPVKIDLLKPYDGSKDQRPGKKKRKGLMKAIKQIECAIKGEPIVSDSESEPKKAKVSRKSESKPKPTAQKSSRSPSPRSPAKSQKARRDRSKSPASSSKNKDSDSESQDEKHRPPKKRPNYSATNGVQSPTKPTTAPVPPSSLAKLIQPVPPSEDRIGFIGCGIMGTPMALNLIKTGHNVSVYNRTQSKTEIFSEQGYSVYHTLRQIIENCDIVFACVSDPKAARDIVFGPDGILQYVTPKKAYVDMSTVDPQTAQDISAAIKAKGGRYLEAPVSGSKRPAEAGELIIMAAGDRSLYVDCYTMFEAMSKKWFFMGDVGTGAKMKLVVNAIMGAHMAALAEGMALAEKCELDQVTLLEILSLGALSSPLVTSKGSAILESNFPSQFPLRHQQKDLRLAMNLSEEVAQPMSVVGSSNELFKRAVAQGHGDRDMASVYRIVNHSDLDHS